MFVLLFFYFFFSVFCKGSLVYFSEDLEIISGDDAYPGQFPWHVSVQNEKNLFCNGAIISENWIVTTGACIGDSPNVTISAGSIHWDHGVFINSENIIVHEWFDNRTLRANIALVELEKSLEFNGNISSIYMGAFQIEANTSLTITSFDYETLNLQWGDVNTIENLECEQVYGYEMVTEGVLCTNGPCIPCVGDIGGPLVLYPDSKPTLVGLFSFIRECQGYPAGFTRIETWRDWITQHSGV